MKGWETHVINNFWTVVLEKTLESSLGCEEIQPVHSEKWRGTKKPLDESERGESKSWLKAQHSENQDHASGPIPSWEIDGETVETVSDIIFLGSKITADGDCSHEIKDAYSLEGKLWPT